MDIIVVLDIVIKLLVYLFVVCLVVSIRYQQIGSTCGFYSLVYGISRVKYIKKKQTVKRIIKDNINNGDSCVGEVFNITLMEKIVQKYFPDVKVEVVEINGTEDLDKLLEENYIVYTCSHEGTPHYCFVENKSDTKYIYRQELFFKSRMEKKKFYQWHKDLNKSNTYEWEKFYGKKKGGFYRLFVLLVQWMKFLSDPELYVFLEKNKKRKKDMLLEQKTISVDMRGKVLIIPRTKIPAK